MLNAHSFAENLKIMILKYSVTRMSKYKRADVCAGLFRHSSSVSLDMDLAGKFRKVTKTERKKKVETTNGKKTT